MPRRGAFILTCSIVVTTLGLASPAHAVVTPCAITVDCPHKTTTALPDDSVIAKTRVLCSTNEWVSVALHMILFYCGNYEPIDPEDEWVEKGCHHEKLAPDAVYEPVAGTKYTKQVVHVPGRTGWWVACTVYEQYHQSNTVSTGTKGSYGVYLTFPGTSPPCPVGPCGSEPAPEAREPEPQTRSSIQHGVPIRT